MKRRLLSMILAALMLVSLLPAAVFAAPAYNDTNGHWAADAIDRWSEYGVVSGKGGDAFDPNGPMRRSEAAQMFANLLGLNKEGDISEFTDVEDDWYTSALAKCYAAGIMSGKGNGKMDPNGLITREEFFTMFARAVCISNGGNAADVKSGLSDKGYTDTAKVSDWAADAIGTLVEKGYVGGVSASEIAPQANINRASVMALLDQSISTYVGKDSTETTVAAKSEGITLIANPAVTTVTGTADVVIVAAGAEQYDETGVKSEIVVDSTASVSKLTVSAEGAKVTVSGKVESVTVAETAKSATVETTSTSTVGTVTIAAESATASVAGKVESVTVAESAKSATVETAASSTVGTLNVAAEDAKTTVAGKVETVKVEETAKNVAVETKSTAKVETVENKAENTAVTGEGSVGAVKSSEDVKIETKNTKVENTSETKEIAVTDSKGTETKVETKTEGAETTKPETTVNTQPTGGGGDSHSHTYSNIWSVDATNHWHAATCEHTSETSGKAAHNTDGEGGVCSDCGYKADSVAVIYGTTNQYFTTLAAAINAVGENETVVLLKDSNVVTGYAKTYGEGGYSEAVGDNRLIIGADGAKNFTLDLNGKTLTGRINFLHGNLTIKNGNLRSSSQAVNVFGSKNYEDRDTEYTVVTIAEDVVITADGYGVAVFGGDPNDIYHPLGFGEVVNFYGKVNAPTGIGDSGNIGNDTYQSNIGTSAEIEKLFTESNCSSCSELMTKYGPVLNFYDGAVVNASKQAVYWPGLGTINVMGGSITGTEAIGIKGGIVNVSGGTLTANGPKCDPVAAVNSGEEASGAAISISTYYNANYPITVNISGGTLKSSNNVALLVAHSVKGDVSTKVTQGINLTVSGGTFVGGSELGGVYVEAALEGETGKYPAKFITGGTFDKDPSTNVATGYTATEAEGVWTVAECTAHTHDSSFTMTADEHSFTCSKCGKSVDEEHTIKDGVCTVCDYKTDAKLLEENANYTCRIGNKGYVYVLGQGAYNTTETKASAIDNAKDGDVIKLLADYRANSYWAKTFRNGEAVTIDLNGKTIELPGSMELNGGIYNIVDSSENGSGKIVDMSISTSQSVATTVNIYGGNFDRILVSTGKDYAKKLNIFGGSVRLIVRDEFYNTADEINIQSGGVSYLSVDNGFHGQYNVSLWLTLKDGYSLGEEITGEQKTQIDPLTYTKLYPIVPAE